MVKAYNMVGKGRNTCKNIAGTSYESGNLKTLRKWENDINMDLLNVSMSRSRTWGELQYIRTASND
jgi:hypothetical protein